MVDSLRKVGVHSKKLFSFVHFLLFVQEYQDVRKGRQIGLEGKRLTWRLPLPFTNYVTRSLISKTEIEMSAGLV